MATALPPVTAKRIKIAADYGIANAAIAATASRTAGLPFYAACALLEKESKGHNVFGHDAGGALSGFPGEVTKDTYAVFRWLVVTKGQTPNGVGPCQITYAGSRTKSGGRSGGYFTQMEAEGLKPYDVHDNMLFGFELLLDHYNASSKSWRAAGTAYNGAASYGADLDAKAQAWKRRLGISK